MYSQWIYSLQVVKESTMENLGLEELKDIFQSLKDVSKCAVCLHTLRPDTVICVNGHVVCEVCKGGQKICPTCRKVFSNVEKPAFLRQVLELIPHTCRYGTCKHFVKSKDDHEKYCSSRPINCKDCEWEGPVKEFKQHWTQQHSAKTMGDVLTATPTGFSTERNHGPSILAMEIDNHFVWVEREYKSDSRLMTWSFAPVLNGKPTRKVYFAKITFESDRLHYTFGVSVEVDHLDKDKNIVYVPAAVLEHFVSNNQLEYKISLTS